MEGAWLQLSLLAAEAAGVEADGNPPPHSQHATLLVPARRSPVLRDQPSSTKLGTQLRWRSGGGPQGA